MNLDVKLTKNTASEIEKKASDLFSRFLGCGIVLLITSIIYFKSGVSESSHIKLGIAIFFINTVTIFGYFFSIKSQGLVDDPDAADLAYYLGFILTICALASIFIFEALYSSNDLNKSQLIQHAIFQFGVGLTATMFGLWARILLAAQSTFDTNGADPKKIYRALNDQLSVFRREISALNGQLGNEISGLTSQLKKDVNGLVQEMNKSQESMSRHSNNYAEALKTCFADLQEMTKKANSSFNEVGNELCQANQKMVTNLNAKGVDQSIASFLKSLNELKEVAVSFTETKKSFVASFENITGATGNLLTQFSSFGDGFKTANNHLDVMKNNMKLSADGLFTLQREIGSLANVLSSSKVALDNFAQATKSLEGVRFVPKKWQWFKKWLE
ncbi:MAG: hypothetical protein IPK86_03220 [Neisseriales bacterium]|nr:MAG: hypothetical protein IPK86_03220 [Neisseriales bacterium]